MIFLIYLLIAFASSSNCQNVAHLSNTTQIDLDIPFDVIIFGTICFSLIFIMGLMGNILVIVVLFKNKELRNCTNYFLANLSIADLMILVVCVPTALHDLYAKERWYLGMIVCKLIAFIENCAGIASIFTILFISCERFFAICQPFKVQAIITKSRTIKLVILIWLIAFGVNLPFIYLTKYETNHTFRDSNTTGTRCVTAIESNLAQAYFIINTFVVYMVIGILLIVIYVNISKSLAKSTSIFVKTSKDFKKQNFKKCGGDDDAETDIGQQSKLLKDNHNNIIFKDNLLHVNNTMSYLKPRRQLILMLICIICVFYICIFPSKISFLFSRELSAHLSISTFYYIDIILRALFYLNSSINPILYNWLSTKFRRCFMKALGCSLQHAQNPLNLHYNQTRLQYHDTTTLGTNSTCLNNGSIGNAAMMMVIKKGSTTSSIYK